MTSIERLKKGTIWLGILGFMLSIILWALTYGLAVGWEITFKNNLLLRDLPNIFNYMAGSCFLISVFFLLFIVFTQARDNIFFKVVGLILLVFVMLQCRILIFTRPNKLPDWATEYSSGLEVLLYIGFFFLALSVILLILQLYLIWMLHRPTR